MPYKDPEKERERSRKRRADPEYRQKSAETIKRWAKAHPESLRAAAKRYRGKNLEKIRAADRAHAKAHPEKVHHKNCRRYGITQIEYERRFEEQRGVCAICNQPETHMRNGRPLNLAIDHDHRTSRVRMLLCHRCNTGLGSFRDSAALLRIAAAYVERFDTMKEDS
jgi:Recombination endonuclease VII